MDKPLILVLIALSWATAAHGVNVDPVAADRNYQVIVERNPFGLKPLPPPPTNAPPPVLPKDEILLTGITSFGGMRAYFMSKAPQGKTPEYFNLGADQSKNGLEVVEINPQNQSVRVRNGGVESVMTFAANGVKPPATPAAPAPGTPGAGGAPATTALPGAGALPGAMGGVNAGNPAMANAAGAAGTGRVRTIPSRNVRTPAMGGNVGMGGNLGGDPNLQNARPDPNAAVQDVLMMELQKRGNPNVAFPPTPMPQ